MHLKLLSRFRKQTLQVANSDLVLRPPSQNDFKQWSDLRQKSEKFLRPWEPLWPADDLTQVGFQRRLKAYEQHKNSGWGKTYLLFNDRSGELLGGLSLTRISYGISRSATLGYWMGEPHAGKGHMKQAVSAILSHAFSEVGLNRVEAACLPKNDRSIHLLKSSGFKKEGFAREYLEINGKAEDHVLFAKLKSDH